MEWRALLARLRQALHPDPDAATILDASERIETGINRRHFLRAALVGAVAAATVDVEQLLWTPGETTLFLPTPEELNAFATADWLSREALRMLTNNLRIANQFSREYESSGIGDLITVRVPPRVDLRRFGV